MAIIRFAINIPQQVHLQSLEPRLVDSQFGGTQCLFSSQEGQFYVSDKVGPILVEQFVKLGVQPGMPVEITKQQTGANKTQWVVSLPVAAAPPEPPSDLERKLAESIRQNEARKQAKLAPVAVPNPKPAPVADTPAWARSLAAQTKQLIDVYAEALVYAGEQHGNAVKPEDVRAMMTTLFINMSKGGASNVA